MGFLCRNADRATVRVATEQRTLGSAQDFDTLGIDQVEDAADRPRNINLIDVQADAGFGRRQEFFLPDAANIDGRRVAGAAEARVILKGQVRHERGNLRDIRHAPVFEPVAGIGRDGDRRILQAFFGLARRHGHFVNGNAFSRTIVGCKTGCCTEQANTCNGTP